MSLLDEIHKKEFELLKLRHENEKKNNGDSGLKEQIKNLEKEIENLEIQLSEKDVKIALLKDQLNNASGCEDALEDVPIITIPDNLAFKGAMGAGAYATGGKEKEEYVITNLNHSGEGSFGEALELAAQENGLRITTAVEGNIILPERLDMTLNNTSIDLRGPNGKGITITGETLILKGNNNIFRYFRKRRGTKDKDAFSGYYLTNSILDHLSFSFGEDEAASFVTDTNKDFKDVTIQNCFFAESKTGSLVGSQNSNGNNFYDYTDRISFLNNLFYNVSHRFANFYANGRGDFVGNVVWNMKKRLIRANGNIKLNQYGNYYDYGTPIHDAILNHFGWEPNHSPLIFTANNKIVSINDVREEFGLTYSIEEMNAQNWKSWKWFEDNKPQGVKRGDQLPGDFFTNTAFEWLGVEPLLKSPDEAFDYALENAGCNIVRDGWDAEWINKIKNGERTEYLDEPYPTI
ncbi:hypothetical protein [Winogradskyella sp.]|uniref:pectate lyase family protein n=1 Tax=Winogradskyella sp. TaxID=1883156 RepID=UPI003BAD30E2